MKVKVMDREARMDMAKNPFSADAAVISITDSDREDVVLTHAPAQILWLKCDDVSEEIFEEVLGRKPGVREVHQICRRFHMLSREQIGQLMDFILSLKASDTLICQCEYGQSRSAAVAEAVAEYSEGRGIRFSQIPGIIPTNLCTEICTEPLSKGLR